MEKLESEESEENDESSWRKTLDNLKLHRDACKKLLQLFSKEKKKNVGNWMKRAS